MAAAIRVLFVGDEQPLLTIANLFLERSGDFNVTTALSAPEALQLLKQEKFDAIISDYQMPEMDGIQFLVEVRESFGAIPFILFAGRGREEIVIQAINSGADFYIQKGGEPKAQFVELSHKIRQATSRKKANDALRESEERLRMLLMHVPSIAVYGYSMDGTANYWYEGAENLYGYSKEEAIGKNLVELIIPPEMRDEFKKVIMYMAKSGQPMPASELTLMKKDGTRVLVFSSHVIIKRSQGEMELYCLDIDLTEQKRVEEAQRQANKKLNHLFSITRHDINNQLTVQMGYLELLTNSKLDPTQAEYFQTVATAAQSISDLIQFTKEYGQIGVNTPAWHDCCTLVDTAAKQDPLGKVKIKNDLPAGTNVFADPLIVKVCYNLINNAVQYGKKTSTIRFSAEERDGDHVIVCEDDGVGIGAEDKEKIFDRRFSKNTGPGLALAREILDITGITIRETGEPGKGARFEMVIPKGAWRRIEKGG